jgi:hypothetical protein
VILREPDERVWLEKARALRSRSGLALSLTHPDYVFDEPLLGRYRRFLGEFAHDETAWRALPREVAAWWRARAESRPVLDRGSWRAEGPAAEGRVVLR